MDLTDLQAIGEGKAIDFANQVRLKKPKRHGGHARYGNPEREVISRQVVHYSTPQPEMPEWMKNHYATPRRTG